MTPVPIYFDYQATTPLDPMARKAMEPYWDTHFGNPHAIDHRYGIDAAQAIRHARAEVACFMNADDDTIVLTSGATESCNLALRGVVAKVLPGGRDQIITVATEHPAVFETVQQLAGPMIKINILPVGPTGQLDLDRLDDVLDDRTLLVSVMAANNEIGTLHPLSEIAARCHRVGALLHTDATQAAGRIPIDVEAWDVDLLSISAHKMYGPKGVGALFVREGVDLAPMITGGGQERNRRSGTLATPLVIGFGAACTVVRETLPTDRRHLDHLTARLLRALTDICPELELFGELTHRLPGNLNIGFPGLPALQVVHCLTDRIAIATGSACSSVRSAPSRVLSALGVDSDRAATALRISLGRFTTENEIDRAVGIFAEITASS
ncbi:MAG: cysteine desulfurase family protein [Aestuariivita sp.]|nr:cysteine desulfurase family protein [Aestuariivita sp.]MCY4201831.1 cysteine desulfurase family protein [Aestuariivita sp.]